MSRYAARAALILAGLFVALVLAEALLRQRAPLKLMNAWVLSHPERVLDVDLIYANPLHTRAFYYRPRAKRPALVALGDSFTAGFPVGRRKSYPARLRNQLGRAGAPMRVINLGVGDTGPDQHLRLFIKYALPHVNPRVVVWQFYTNDLWDNVTKPVYEIEAGKLAPIAASENWLYRRGVFFNLTPLPAFIKLRSRVYQSVLKATEHWMKAQVPPEYSRNPEDWAVEKIRLEIGEMERLARERGFRAYYTLVPPQSLWIEPKREEDVKPIKWARDNHAILREILATLPSFIDLVLDAHGAESTARYYASSERDPNWLGDRHLNEAGYREMARQIAERLLADRQGRADLVSAPP